MEMTFSRQFLDVAGILDFIVGILALILSIIVSGAGIVIINEPELAAELPSAFGSYTVLIIGIVIAAVSLFAIFSGCLERAAAKDPAKITPVWVMSLVFVVINTFIIIYYLFQDLAIHDIAFEFFSLALAVVVFIASDIIKKEVDFG